MTKIIKEYETKYSVGDVVIFQKNKILYVGLIEGYYIDNDNFWFNIRTTPDFVYSYSNGGDVAEWDIMGIVNGELGVSCEKLITRD